MARTSYEYRKATTALYGGLPRAADRYTALLWALLAILFAGAHLYKSMNSEYWMPLFLLFQAATIGPNLPDPQDIPLKTLEDRADFQFGKSFDELLPAQQDSLLSGQQQSSVLFTPLSPGLKYPNLVPDLAYIGKLHRARSVLLFGLLGLVAAHCIVVLLPRIPFLAGCFTQARPPFWCIFGALLFPSLFLVWRGPRRIEGRQS